MIIITDLLIIDHLISVFATLPYLPLVFRHLNSLPYIILNLNKRTIYYPLLCLTITRWVANSVDPDETPHLRRLIRVYTVCSGLSDRIY